MVFGSRGVAAMPEGGGRARPGFETTRRAQLAARPASGRTAACRHIQQPHNRKAGHVAAVYLARRPGGGHSIHTRGHTQHRRHTRTTQMFHVKHPPGHALAQRPARGRKWHT